MTPSNNPEAEFLSTIMARTTHELRNVLAIVKESAGLIEDIVRVCRDKGALDEEKVQRATGRIDAQVKRGADLLTNLNRLSHALDRDRDTVDLRQDLEQVVFLSQRFARKSGQEIAAEEGEGETLTTHPLRLQMILFAAIQCCLEQFPEGARITLRSGSRDGSPVVTFKGEWREGEAAGRLQEAEAWSCMVDLADSLGVELEVGPDGTGGQLVFSERDG